MATFNLTAKTTVAGSTSAEIVSTPVIPTVTNYGQWYSAGSCTWTPMGGDVITITGWVFYDLQSVTCTTGQRLACYVRTRLVNASTGYDVWSGTETAQIFGAIDTDQYGVAKGIQSFNVTFQAMRPGILDYGNHYVLYIEVMKERTLGTPSVTFVVVDASIFSDTAAVTRV